MNAKIPKHFLYNMPVSSFSLAFLVAIAYNINRTAHILMLKYEKEAAYGTDHR